MSFDRGPQLEPDLVLDFVRAAHGDLARVQEMLAAEPSLVNACWDWGSGDWETALGGAAHMGHKEIADYLLANGARLDLFCAAMLGKRAIVEAFLADDPSLATAAGPHGIPLIVHARAGGQDDLVAYLSGLAE